MLLLNSISRACILLAGHACPLYVLLQSLWAQYLNAELLYPALWSEDVVVLRISQLLLNNIKVDSFRDIIVEQTVSVCFKVIGGNIFIESCRQEEHHHLRLAANCPLGDDDHFYVN